jgi:hypothetical protein
MPYIADWLLKISKNSETESPQSYINLIDQIEYDEENIHSDSVFNY